jgi:hypothetical protein
VHGLPSTPDDATNVRVRAAVHDASDVAPAVLVVSFGQAVGVVELAAQ